MNSAKKSMSISAKLILSNMCYAIPVAVMIYLLASVQGENIKFAEWERKGNAYQATLEMTLYDVGRHSWLSMRAARGEAGLESQISDLQAKIEADFAAVQEVDKLHGADLQVTPEGLKQRNREHLALQTFHQEWTQLKGDLKTLKPEDSIARHAHLVTDMRGLITHVGDTSNLILDPDLDSYYMMDVTLAAMPQMQERLTEIIHRGETILAARTLTPEDRLWLITVGAFLKADYDRAAGDTQTAINEDKNFYETSESLQKEVPPATAALGERIDALLKVLSAMNDTSNKTDITQESFRTAAEAAYSQSFAYWDVMVRELEVLLEKRIEDQAATKTRRLLYSFVALALAALGSTLLGMSIRSGVIRSVSEVVDQMREIAQAVLASNQRLVSSSTELASGTSQQAEAIQRTVSTLDEINSMTGKSAENAQHSASESKESQAAALESKKSVQDLVLALSEINQSNNDMISRVGESNQKIVDIVGMIREIGEKTKVINDIVFQTRLLSFNASVEAARAGEHGKGFSVVAEEVGNLARMSGGAAQEITALLEKSTQRVNSIVDETRQSLQETVKSGKDKLDLGMKIAVNCEDTLSTAVSKVEKVNVMMAEIAEAAKEQAVGVSEIGQAMNMFDQATQKNSMSAEEAADLAKELESQAARLQASIQDLEKRIGYVPSKEKTAA